MRKVLRRSRPHLMVTDPPYGVDYDASWRNKALGEAHAGRALARASNDDRIDWREAWDLFPGDVAYVWHAGTHTPLVGLSLMASGFELRSQIIWVKQRIVIGRGHYHCKHEPCWYVVRKGGNSHWRGTQDDQGIWVITGGRKASTVWEIDRPIKSETGHSTQKPIECMRRPMLRNSDLGDIIYDPFAGSGTTIIAAEKEGRACYAIELEPAYVDVCIRRWIAYTGRAREAIRSSDGAIYTELTQD